FADAARHHPARRHPGRAGQSRRRPALPGARSAPARRTGALRRGVRRRPATGAGDRHEDRRGGRRMTALLPPPAAGTPGEEPVSGPPAARSRTGAAWRTASRRVTPGAVAAGVVLAVIALAALAPGLLSTHDPFEPHPDQVLLAPSGSYWLGTDYLGRDIYSRLVHGTGMSVVSALIAVAIGLVAGSAIGLVGGHWADRAIDVVLMRFVDTLLAIPGLLLSMAIVVALGFSTVNAAVAVGVSAIAVFARLMRSEVLRIKRLPYLEAAELVGARGRALLLSHIVPNA